MKKIIPCLITGIVIGAGAMCGVTQIPSVKSSLFKDTNSYENLDLEAENSDLKLNNSILQENLEKLNSELLSCNNLIKQKDETIASKVAKIDQLTTEKTQLQAELDSYKNSTGDGSDNSEIIANLQSQLELKTSELNTATAELEQLRVDKSSLETRVQELETELAKVQEELKKFKDNENIDKLNVSSYNGTWYLNGTFEKYFIIKDGVVTLNASEDNGVVQCLYNQMYLFLNGNGSIPVTLSDDGNSFETADGEIFKRFYINTTETVLSSYSFVGTYNYSNINLILNGDNTLSYSISDETFYGAYVVKTLKRNVGGNIVYYDTITATIQMYNEPIVMEFEHNSNDPNSLYFDDICFDKTSGVEAITILKNGTSLPSSYYKIRIRTQDFVVINPGDRVLLNLSINSCNGSVSYSRYFNGDSYSTSPVIVITTSATDSYRGCFFDIYMWQYSNSNYWKAQQVSDVYSFAGVPCDIVSIENVGMKESDYPLYGHMLDVYNSSKNTETFKKSCDIVNDYVNGTYSNDNISLLLNDDSSTITYTGEESITPTNIDISATTDGYDIYHNIVLTYTRLEMVDGIETEVTHTIELEFKNDSLTSSLLDDGTINLI